MTKNRATRRRYFLAINASAINLALVYSLVTAEAGDRAVAEVELPPFQTQLIDAKKSDSELPIASATERLRGKQAYQFTFERQLINLEMSYLVGTRGDIAQYLQDYSKIAPGAIAQRQIKQTDVGYHLLLKDRENVYLTSCISPRSFSSVTQKQFSQQRYQNDLNLNTAWQWLRGKESIRDRRCLWVLLATASDQPNSQTESQTLEAAWQDLYRWWLPNFPAISANN